MEKLICNGRVYEGDDILDVDCIASGSIVADELTVDTLSATIHTDQIYPTATSDDLPLATADGVWMIAKDRQERPDQDGQYGDEVYYYHDDALVGKFRLERIVRTGKYQYKLSCISDVGLLISEYHYGGIYSGETAADVIEDVIGGIVPYTIDASLGAVPVYGLLRKGTRRDNLRDVLYAIGGQIRKDTVGEINIIPMSPGTAYEITVDEFYEGGSVTGGNEATGVDLIEHGFAALASDPVVTLYDAPAYASEVVTPRGATVSGVLIDFEEPVHDLAIQNAEILESGVNYAVISGSPAAVLTGKEYTHTQRVISRRWASSRTPNVITSSACTLVNMLNSERVADRLQAYYGSAKTVEADIVVSGQKPGDAVTFQDPFGDSTDGYIATMEMTMSKIMKSMTTIVSGYIPREYGNYYSHELAITANTTVTIPPDAKSKALLVLIGGGYGGGLGNSGEEGQGADKGAKGGAGGQPGIPGAGGKISVYTIPVIPGQKYQVSIGKGGIGATLTADATPGGNTTFGQYSSADGFASEAGYVDVLTGEVYGNLGEAGTPGGNGSSISETGASVVYNGVTYTPGAKGDDETKGGETGYGGYGGGAAAGANGGAGAAGDVYKQPSGDDYFATGGDGGTGATPVKAATGKVPGQGGQAGHGSGGGGGGGQGSDWPGGGGKPGDPGAGGNGASGIALLFY